MYLSVFAVGGRFQSFLKDLGIFGPILFMYIQVIKVLYSVIPGSLTSVISHVLFWPLIGFVYNTTGIFLASTIAFLLARRYGQDFVQSFVSESIYNKHIVYLDKGKMFESFLATTFVFPDFPDDFLCMVAVMSKKPLRCFIWLTLLTKPTTLYLYTVLSYNGLQMLNQFFSLNSSKTILILLAPKADFYLPFFHEFSSILWYNSLIRHFREQKKI